MPEYAAFIRTINARPDDDAPRLVFADWLDERGECARADFIRVQIEHARLDPHEYLARSRKAHADRLLRAHRHLWEPRFASRRFVEEGNPIEFCRGFAELNVRAGTLLDLADELAETCPVPAVRLLGRDDEDDDIRFDRVLERLAAHPVLRRVSVIHLGLSDFELGTLLGSPQLVNLRRLGLSFRGLSVRGIAALAAAPGVAAVRVLSLRSLGLGDDSAAALAGSPLLANLRSLDLMNNMIGDDGVEALAGSAALAGLHVLSLQANRISRRGALALAGSPHLRGLQELHLQFNDIDETGAAALAGVFGPRVYC